MRSSRWMAWVVGSVILGVSALAYSSLPDQIWLAGFYDGADEDDAPLVQVQVPTGLAPAIVHASTAAGLGAIASQLTERVPSAHVLRPPQTRAPPDPRSFQS